MKIYIQHRTTVLSQEEIDELLTPLNPKRMIEKIKLIPLKIKWFYRNICQWKLIIEINNAEYTICLSGIKIICNIMYDDKAKEPTPEDKCKWKNVFLKIRFDTADNAKQFLQNNFERISQMVYVEDED